MTARPKMLLKASLGVAAATALVALATVVLAGGATAGSPRMQQRIKIAFHSSAGRFVLTPLTPGPIVRDAGSYVPCCWTRRPLIQDGESVEIDDPTVVFTSKRATFTWYEHITFVDSDNGYGVATATWTIVHGTGAYAHLEGHGREAAVNRGPQDVEVAAQAEGLVDLGR